jgi:Cellulase (glycosyl hydrolase family 5)
MTPINPSLQPSINPLIGLTAAPRLRNPTAMAAEAELRGASVSWLGAASVFSRRPHFAMIRRHLWLFAFALTALVVSAAPLELKLRRLVKTEPGQDQWNIVETPAEWNPAGTAAVICDMWDQHWCQGASMYNSRQRPFVDHFTGNDLVTWHIEKYWCPTITSDQVLGGKPFRFAGDTKPVWVFPSVHRAGAAAPPPQGAGTAIAFVRGSSRDARYFELADGTPYIPIGLNMIAPPGNEGLPGLEAWMAQLEANGGNYIRIWLGNPFFDVEHEHSGEYDEEKAKRIETMLAIAARHGIRVKLCLESFRHLGDGHQSWAAKPLHLVANGGTATNINDFFDGTASRELFKKKLAWFAQRFGDNPTVFGWELWNEINAVQGGDYLGWTEIMLPELHRLFPHNLAMQSLGSYDGEHARAPYRRLATMPGNDVAQVHRYLDLGAKLEVCHGPMDLLASDAVRELLSLHSGRPVLLAESGAVERGHSGPFKLYNQDTNGVLLHDVLFAPFFSGAAGPGHIWHWDSYVAKQNLWWQFGRFAAVVKDLDPPAEHFQSEMLGHPRLRVYVLKGQRAALLWCRDTQNTWQRELAEGKPAEPIEGAVLDLEPLKLSQASARIYDPWENRWTPGVLEGARLRLPSFKRSIVVRIALGLQKP